MLGQQEGDSDRRRHQQCQRDAQADKLALVTSTNPFLGGLVGVGGGGRPVPLLDLKGDEVRGLFLGFGGVDAVVAVAASVAVVGLAFELWVHFRWLA
jgi:hypothetical protein